MRSTDKRTFLDEARRAQIVACAIEVIAEKGYANSSLSQIAERAGTSKGVILYHFAGKDELIEKVVAEVFTVATAQLLPKLQSESTACGQLRAYIEARVGFLTTHLAHMRALMDIWLSYRAPDGGMRLAGAGEPTLDGIEQLLARGQRDGEFRKFPTRPMAVAIGQAIDGALLQLVAHPDMDLDAFAAELVMIFDLATASSSRRQK